MFNSSTNINKTNDHIRSHLTLNTHKTTTGGDQDPTLGQTPKCYGVRPVNRSSTLPSKNIKLKVTFDNTANNTNHSSNKPQTL